MDHAFIEAYGNDEAAPETTAETTPRAYPTPAERNAKLGRRPRIFRVDGPAPAQTAGRAVPHPHVDFAPPADAGATEYEPAESSPLETLASRVDAAASSRAAQLERELQIEREMRIAREMQLEREIMFSRQMLRQQELRADVQQQLLEQESEFGPEAIAEPEASAAPANETLEEAAAGAPDNSLVEQEETDDVLALNTYATELAIGGGVATLDETSFVVGPQLHVWPPVEAHAPAPTQAAPKSAPKAAPTQEKAVAKTAKTVEVAEPVAEQPVAEQPVANEPVTQEPIAEEPMAETKPSQEAETHEACAAKAAGCSPIEEAADDQQHAQAHDSLHDTETETTGPIAEAVAHDKPATKEPPRNQQASADPAPQAREKNRPKAAAWEVDRFVWPENIQRLQQAEAEYFRHAGKKLRDASREGLCRLAVASTQAGEGATTLAICLARAAAAAGAKVAILDANLRRPELGELFGLDFANSWHEALDGEVPLSEAAVRSLADDLTLMPLSWEAARWSVVLDDHRLVQLLDQAREVFDIVLIDLGSLFADSPDGFPEGCPVAFDAAIVVRDVRRTSEDETLETVARFKALGVDAVGVAENFRARQASRKAA